MSDQISILVADDDEQLRSMLNEQLVTEGYHVSTASDGEQALNLINHGKFNVAVLDIKMPKVTGFEVLEFIKKNFPEIRIIMLTAYADIRNINKCKELGAHDVIEKPYDIGDLFDSIRFVTKK